MITNAEFQTLTLSPTNKDYYQIWNELLETASKISERWDPTSTNESDPGIVLLKVLTAVADKLNYTVDANTREAFMPTAAQEESMRKLCEMMGYNIKYYQSATTDVIFSYNSTTDDDGSTVLLPSAGLLIPLFTAVYNNDKDVSYVTTKPIYLDNNATSKEVPVIEGQLVQCESDSDNIITLNQIDDNCRYYLPEVQVAENGIFVFEVVDGKTIENTSTWKKVDNLNTQVKGTTCWKFGFDSLEGQPYIQFPDDIAHLIKDGFEIYYIRTSGINGNISRQTLSTFDMPTEGGWEDYSSDNFTVTNASAATNGRNIETITQAYNGFKKTVGTFDTLVTCRDYMNKIYQLVDSSNNPLISNVIVSDIRDDLNNAVNICSFNDFGISYVDRSRCGSAGAKLLDNFELILYPFKKYANSTKADYKNSFKYTDEPKSDIEAKIKENKTLSHVFKLPSTTNKDIVCIKNYLKLNATITTMSKINAIEREAIIDNIKTALYDTFNMREVDFGENIPVDTIASCIENADSRIKNIFLDTPKLETRFLLADGNEVDATKTADWNNCLIKMCTKNILAGRVPLFNYNTDFSTDIFEASTGSGIYPSSGNYISKIESQMTMDINETDQTQNKLTENEVVSFRTPNYITKITYPAYVNYFLKRNSSSTDTSAQPAQLTTLRYWLTAKAYWADLMNSCWPSKTGDMPSSVEEVTGTDIDTLKDSYGEVFSYNAGATTTNKWQVATEIVSGTNYYGIKVKTDSAFQKIAQFTLQNKPAALEVEYSNLWRSLGYDAKNPSAGINNMDGVKFQQVTVSKGLYDWDSYYVMLDPGKDAELTKIEKNTEYVLQRGEYLFINYTEASTTDSSSESTNIVKNITYETGDIIRPNFDLYDSQLVHNTTTTSWKKTSGYEFNISGVKVPGMYSLGADEQIEIVKESKIVLTGYQKGIDQKGSTSSEKGTVNVFWYLLSGSDLIPDKADPAAGNKLSGCKFTEIDPNSNWGYLEYMLKDGEYFFYTDKNKLDMAYYGAGTLLKIYGKYKDGLKRTRTTDSTSAEEITIDSILSEGIIAIPWVQLSLTRTQNPTAPTGNDKNKDWIELVEYKYINLVKDYTIVSLPGISSLASGSWAEIGAHTTCKYIDSSKNDQEFNTGSGKWEVSCYLDINTNPYSGQTLNTDRDTLKITYGTDQEASVTLGKNGAPVHGNIVKTNKTYQTAAEVVYCQEADGVKMKSYSMADAGEVGIADKTVTINNLSNTWTKIKLSELGYGNIQDQTPFKFNVNIADSTTFGLMMFYYTIDNDNGISDRPFIKISESEVLSDDLEIFNLGNDSKWWAGYKPDRDSQANTGIYQLKPGINIIKFPTSHKLEFYSGADTDTSKVLDESIIFSSLDIINKETDNTDGIDYKSLGIFKSCTSNLLTALREADPNHEFYYNAPMDYSTTIDLNTDAGYSLISPETYYDYNNICNKFVISEIDADYLDTGLQIAWSSQKR